MGGTVISGDSSAVQQHSAEIYTEAGNIAILTWPLPELPVYASNCSDIFAYYFQNNS